MNGYLCQGFNPLQAFPNKAKLTEGLSKLKLLVVMDPLETETARFWENHGDYNDVDTAAIQTEVIQLPTTCFAEDEGSLVNSGRWLQWHWAGGTPPGEAKTDIWIMAQIYLRLKELYREGGRRLPRPDPQSALALQGPGRARRRGARQGDERLRRWRTCPTRTDPTKMLLEAGKQIAGFAQLRDDGTTACGCWIFSGCFTEDGNMMARRDNTDPDDTGAYPNWALAWPANRRILYNRASGDIDGKPWDPSRKLIEWNGRSGRATTCPISRRPPSRTRSVPFIMNPEGVARLFARGPDARRAVPGALRAVRKPGRQRPRPEGARQPGGAGVRGRLGRSSRTSPRRTSPTRRPPTG